MSVAHKRMLYIGGLDDAVTEDLVRAAFIPFGEILSINLPADAVSSNCCNLRVFTVCLQKNTEDLDL
jgi:peptidyl-prolyl isomerase E (cyclophilin E)